MAISLDVITRKKLILVKQIYQRAVLQTELQHSPVDRIMAVIAFDLAHETTLKAVAGALTSKPVKTEFQEILQQADHLLLTSGLPEVPDKAKIQYIRGIRNDAQHKAKYPGPNEVNDTRTYSRDFLKQILLNVWNEYFDSISLIEAIQDSESKGYLKASEDELAKGHHRESVCQSMAAFGHAIGNVRRSIIGSSLDRIRGIMVSDGQKEIVSAPLLASFKTTQDTLMRSVIGLNFGGYLRFNKITKETGTVAFLETARCRWLFLVTSQMSKKPNFVWSLRLMRFYKLNP